MLLLKESFNRGCYNEYRYTFNHTCFERMCLTRSEGTPNPCEGRGVSEEQQYGTVKVEKIVIIIEVKSLKRIIIKRTNGKSRLTLCLQRIIKFNFSARFPSSLYL